MKKKRAFTLIELLVVISIIALLVSILMPALGEARKQAKAAVCMAQLKQWGLSYHLFAEDHEGKMPDFVDGTEDTTFMESLRDYYDDINEMRTCPMAERVSEIPNYSTGNSSQPDSYFGDTFKAWQIDSSAPWLDDEDWGIGSYGENTWIRNYNDAKSWKKIDVKHTDEIPLIMDARWNNIWPDNSNICPSVDVFAGGAFAWATMDNLCMRRHGEGINICFMDSSVRRVDAEELWSLRWNKATGTAGYKKRYSDDIYDDLSWME